MPARVYFPGWLEDVFMGLPPGEQDSILEKLESVRLFPRMCPMRRTGRWQGLRWFVARDWLVYYDYVPADNTIYVRNLWPARAVPS